KVPSGLRREGRAKNRVRDRSTGSHFAAGRGRRGRVRLRLRRDNVQKRPFGTARRSPPSQPCIAHTKPAPFKFHGAGCYDVGVDSSVVSYGEDIFADGFEQVRAARPPDLESRPKSP